MVLLQSLSFELKKELLPKARVARNISHHGNAFLDHKKNDMAIYQTSNGYFL